MKKQTLNIYAERLVRQNSIALHLVNDNGQRVDVARPVAMEQIEPGAYAEPFLALPVDVAQQLIDELWNCGLRPTPGHGSAGQLAATERHLADMKTLAFHALKVPHG